MENNSEKRECGGSGGKLDDVATTELIDELMGRCVTGVFIGTKQEDGGVPTVFWHWVGEEGGCYGSCYQLAYYIQRGTIYNEVMDALEDK